MFNASPTHALVREVLAEALGLGVATKALPSSTPTSIYMHGANGLFSTPGLSKPVFSAMGLPNSGLAARLPVQTSQETNPIRALITGVDASTGTEPNGPCDDPPTAGLVRACSTAFVFGRFSRQSRVFDITRVGEVTNRGEFLDLTLQGGSPTADSPLVPTIPNNPGMADVLRNEVKTGLWELGVAFARDFGRKLYTGNPTNNTGGGGYKEYKGLDILINTGYVDAVNGSTTCPAVDSIIRDFASINVNANGSTTVRTFTNVYRNLKKRASDMGLDPVSWVFAMRWSLFQELTEVWPCAYVSYRCQATTGELQISASDQIAMREQMRTGLYLLIDGEKVPVVIDDNIAETEPTTGNFKSDVYIVPLRVLGNIAATYYETFDFSGANGAIEAARIMAPSGMFEVSDGGRFLWHKKPANNWCVQMMAITKPRVILETPHLAARITNLVYTPLAHERSMWPDEGSYVAGGVTTR